MSERIRKKRKLLVFRAFFDESATDSKANKAFVMGGFLARVEEWESASDAWDACLKEPPSIEYFKHSEAQSLSEQFARFNRTTADEKVLALATVISKFTQLRGFCITVAHRLFRHYDAKATEGMIGTRVYDWGFMASTSGLLQYLDDEHPGDEKIDFVFDDCSQLTACIENYNWMKTEPFLKEIMRRAGQCSPGDDKQVAALQMGDLLAWEFSKFIETKARSKAFNLIAGSNTISHVLGEPPRQFPQTLALQKISNQVLREAGDFFRRSKKGSPDRFTSEQEVDAYINELKVHEAYVQLEWNRYRSQLDGDAEYQEFRRKYLAAQQAAQDTTDEEES
jgi:hypothetical protein